MQSRGMQMLEVNDSIINLNKQEIADNLLYYNYNIKHLLSLIKMKISEDDIKYVSAYRSFEGEAFENFMYEKLLVYADNNKHIEKFILKGPHQNRKYNHNNTLSISEQSQIVYRTKTREISEFDAMMFTKNDLYFVEITLVKSVAKLKKRLRKKRALLEIIFPNYNIKALIILNEGVVGVKQLPKYCTVWITKPFSAKDVLEYLRSKQKALKKPKQIFTSKKFIEACELRIFPFKYYNILSWITSSLRLKNRDIIDVEFLLSPIVQRYHNLYSKFYIGYMSGKEFCSMYDYDIDNTQDVVVAIEKKHTGVMVLTYYIQYSRKKLQYLSFDKNNVMQVEKKDPYGITTTEVYHIARMMDKRYALRVDDIQRVQSILSTIIPAT